MNLAHHANSMSDWIGRNKASSHDIGWAVMRLFETKPYEEIITRQGPDARTRAILKKIEEKEELMKNIEEDFQFRLEEECEKEYQKGRKDAARGK